MQLLDRYCHHPIHHQRTGHTGQQRCALVGAGAAAAAAPPGLAGLPAQRLIRWWEVQVVVIQNFLGACCDCLAAAAVAAAAVAAQRVLQMTLPE